MRTTRLATAELGEGAAVPLAEEAPVQFEVRAEAAEANGDRGTVNSH